MPRGRLSAFLLAMMLATAPALAQQVARFFPATALRGIVTIGVFPEITLNGQATRLAPGARIRNGDNMLVTPASMVGQRWTVHYTIEPTSGLVLDVWVLRGDEMAVRPWPTTPEQAAAWQFDPAAQTWTRP